MKRDQEPPSPELLDRMAAFAREEMLKKFKKEKSITALLAQPTIPVRLVSEEELVEVLGSSPEEPCLALLRREGRDYSMWVWLPGLPKFDIFSYRFDRDGTYQLVGSMLHSSMILGK